MTGAYLQKPTNSLLDDFGAGRATPGSGSAAALMGLLASKLIQTVCKKSAEKDPLNQSTFDLIMDDCQRIEAALAQLFEKDSIEFAEVVRLRQLREDAQDQTEASNLSRQSNDMLEKGAIGLFEVAEHCLKLVDYGISVFEDGWEHVRGDSGAAISVAISGAMSCVFIISVNAKTLKRRVSSKDTMKACHELTLRIQSKQNTALKCATNISQEALSAIEDADLLSLAAQNLDEGERTKLRTDAKAISPPAATPE